MASGGNSTTRRRRAFTRLGCLSMLGSGSRTPCVACIVGLCRTSAGGRWRQANLQSSVLPTCAFNSRSLDRP
jgi:hypothetical protein